MNTFLSRLAITTFTARLRNDRSESNRVLRQSAVKPFFLFAILAVYSGCAGRIDGGSRAGGDNASPDAGLVDAAPIEAGPGEPRLLGVWDMTSVDGPESRLSDNHQLTKDFLELEFRADGTVTQRRSGICSEGTYYVADHHVHFAPEGFVVDTRMISDAGLLEFTTEGMSISYVAPTNFWGNFTRISQLPSCD